MCGDAPIPGPVVPVRIPCGSLGCAFGPRRGLVGRLDDALDYTGPILYGLATIATTCRLTFLMRWLKTDTPDGEIDPIA